MSAPAFQLEWKGRALGSFTLADLRTRLTSGEISRLHRVNVEDAWRPLGEWLDVLDAGHHQARADAQSRTEAELDAERTRNAVLEQRLHHVERQAMTPPQPPPPVYSAPLSHPTPPPHYASIPPVQATSGLAIASLCFGVLCVFFFAAFVLLAMDKSWRWLGLLMWGTAISWVLTTILGHLALCEIRRDETIEGRGPALAGLIIGYAVIALITFCMILGTLDNDYRHILR